MPTAPRQIHAPTDPSSFHLLFLSEGFLQADEPAFDAHCRAVKNALLKIDPFVQAARQLAVWTVFAASQERGVGAAPRNTAYGFFLTPQNELRTRKPGTIVRKIADISPVALGGRPAVVSPIPITGSDIWMNDTIAGQSAVCVVVNHRDRAATTTYGYAAGDLDDPADNTDLLKELVPFTAVTMWPRIAGLAQAYTNADDAAAAMLAKQVGLVLGLSDEFEQNDAAHEQFNVLPDPPRVNLVVDASIRAGTTVNLELVPWRSLITGMEPVLSGIQERDHPQIIPNEPEDAEVARYRPIADLMDHNVVLLRHPRDAANPGDSSALAMLRYDTPGRKLLHRRAPQLIEGGAGFRRGIYRPSVDCLMRSEGHDEPTGGNIRRDVEPFCAVCTHYLTTRLVNGAGYFNFGAVRFLRGPPICVSETIPSRMANALKDFITDAGANGGKTLPQKTQSTPRWKCIEATVYRTEKFFKDLLKWSRNTEVPIGLDPDGHEWYSGNGGKVRFPSEAGSPITLWQIFMSDLSALARLVKQNEAAFKHVVALGAPGAMWYAGFACLVNKRQPRQNVVINGRNTTYNEVVSLTPPDLDHVTPGALMQLWPSPNIYRRAVDYALAGNPAAAIPPGIVGHSLFYMGKNAAGLHIVADQEGTEMVLTQPWRSNYQFWIVSQWHEALNVPI